MPLSAVDPTSWFSAAPRLAAALAAALPGARVAVVGAGAEALAGRLGQGAQAARPDDLPPDLDGVILLDVLHRSPDAWAVLRRAHRALRPGGRLAVLWPAGVPAAAGRAAFARADLVGLAELTGFAVHPLPHRPSRGPLAWLVAEAVAQSLRPAPTCSVVVPCRDERGHIDALFERLPELGPRTELVLVDGHSTDGTREAIEPWLARRPHTRLLLQGDRPGKVHAMRQGMAAATGELLLVLDSDLTVPPEDLPRFVHAWRLRGGLINGTRLRYPMEPGAMRPLNALGNRAFAHRVSALLGHRLTDTLCGTKVLHREDYAAIEAQRADFGDWDPFGDFDLLFGAARLGLPITEVPVRYRARQYGHTKIARFRDGLRLANMMRAARRHFG